MKKCRKTRIGVNVLQDRSNCTVGAPIFSTNGQGQGQGCAALCGRPHNLLSLGQGRNFYSRNRSMQCVTGYSLCADQFDTCAMLLRRRRDVTLLIMAALMTSHCRARALPDPVHYAMDEKLSVGTALGRGLMVDAELSRFYSPAELSRLQFSLVRGPPPDLTAQYFTIDQHTGLIQVHRPSII